MTNNEPRHAIEVHTEHRIGGTVWCTCGRYRSGLHGHPNRAKSAGAEHMRATGAQAGQPVAHVERAIDDPVRLARAARIVRMALARQRLTVQDLVPPDESHDRGQR